MLKDNKCPLRIMQTPIPSHTHRGSLSKILFFTSIFLCISTMSLANCHNDNHPALSNHLGLNHGTSFAKRSYLQPLLMPF